MLEGCKLYSVEKVVLVSSIFTVFDPTTHKVTETVTEESKAEAPSVAELIFKIKIEQEKAAVEF